MNFRIWLSALLILGVISPAWAQGDDEDVHTIFFDTIRTGDVRPTPVAVEDMKYIGTQYITAADSQIMGSLTGVVQFDLDFYADFELVRLDPFYLKTYEIKEMDLLGWQRLGAQYLVRLEAEFPAANLRSRWRLLDTKTKQEIGKGLFEGDRYSWRETAHRISNDIVKTLTGERGVFLTQIAYIRKIGKAKEIFIADYDGANERQLTKMGTINISPCFAPSGQDIYFISFRDGDAQLFKVDVNSGKVSKLTNFPGLVSAPAVSPDGNKIACILTKDGNSEIYVLDISGKVIKRLTNHPAIESAPTWSPDGRLIAFTSDRTGSPQIYTMDADGFNVKRLTYEGKYNDSPLWSARGDRVTFVSRTKSGRFDLASIDTSGEGFRILTQVGQNENPHFSPDGKQLIFASTRLGTDDIYTGDLSGRNQRRLTRSGSCSNPIWGPMR
ncbi:MAG: Tol-Pal system beta propeller repeat protein TolB [Candidatus Zixiibacteriota bacterium]